MKAAEKHLFELHDMEEMVEFMKTEVPNWDVQTLQACKHDLLFEWSPSRLGVQQLNMVLSP